MNINILADNKQIISVEDYIKMCGVQDVEEYLRPTNKYIENPYEHINMKEGVQLFKYHYLNNDKTYILCDSGDCDGITSTSILYRYMKRLNYKWNIKIGIHTGKQRGLQDEDLLQDILDKDIKFVIIPDSGTNDKEQAEILKEHGISLLVLDHHELTTPIEYGTLVNNQVGDVDHYGSGCAETFMFLRALDIEFNHKWANDYIDLVGLSTISDSMNITSQQNRKYIEFGLFRYNNIKNGLLLELFNEQLEDGYSQKDIAFKIVPLINSVCRSDNQQLKQDMILGFIGKYKGEYSELVELMKKQHSHQTYVVNKYVNKYFEYKDMPEDEYEECTDAILDTNDCPFNIYIANDLPRSYSGLIAMKLCSKNGKPTIVAKDKGGKCIGSCRSLVECREWLNDNEYVDFANGHSLAFGIGLQSENLYDFLWSLNTFKSSSEPCIDVLQSYTIKYLPKRLFGLYDQYNELWGHGMSNPKFYINNINIDTKKDIQTLGKGNTVKINNSDISIMFFNISDIDKERLMCYNKATLEVVGELNVNEWNGRKYPQIIVDKFEIKEYNNDISLEDLL